MGVKGVLPLGCLPLWGREGVTIITYSNSKKSSEKKLPQHHGFNYSCQEFPGIAFKYPKVLPYHHWRCAYLPGR
jgi:hypothetical protein